ncbi:MAG: MFS transporter [Anaerolineae bacterium]|nr:MFS transporter [Anaerolineae bacterium]
MVWSLTVSRFGSLARRVAQFVPRTDEQRNVLYLCAEVAFAGILAAAGAFNGAFIIRAGGSNALVGLLSSIPSLVAVLLFMPSATVLEGKANYAPWVVWSLFLSRIGYLFMALLPFLLSRYIPEATVGLLVLMTAPAVFFSTGWSPLLADVVPAHRRASVLAWRSIVSSATIALLTYFFGLWLDRGQFPGNYQWLFGLGLIGGLLSVWLVALIRMPQASEAHVSVAQRRPSWWRDLRTLGREHQGFARMILDTFLFNLGAWMVGPLYVIYFVRQLGASDAWLGLHTTLAHVGVVLGYWAWRAIIKRTGEQRALLISLPMVATYAFMVALVGNLNFILFAGFLINVLAPGVNLSHSVIFLDLLPPGRKHSWTALYSMIMNLGAFVAPLIGVALSDRIGIVPTLLVGGVARALGALTFYIWPLQPPEGEQAVSRPVLLPRMFGGIKR